MVFRILCFIEDFFFFSFSSQHHSHEYIFSIPFPSTCITFLFNSIWCIWIHFSHSSLATYFLFPTPPIKLKLRIWIQFKLHAMSFNIFIWMEFNFHRNNWFFFFISWVDCHHSLKPRGSPSLNRVLRICLLNHI